VKRAYSRHMRKQSLDHASSEIYLAGDKEKGALVSLVQDASMYLHKVGSGSNKEKILNSDRYYYFQSY
jgi:hypothetical protein